MGVGPTPVSLVWRGDELSFAWMTQHNPTFGAPLTDLAGAAALLRLPVAAVAGAGLPVQTVSCGVPVLLVPLATRRAVDFTLRWLDGNRWEGVDYRVTVDGVASVAAAVSVRQLA